MFHQHGPARSARHHPDSIISVRFSAAVSGDPRIASRFDLEQVMQRCGRSPVVALLRRAFQYGIPNVLRRRFQDDEAPILDFGSAAY